MQVFHICQGIRRTIRNSQGIRRALKKVRTLSQIQITIYGPPPFGTAIIDYSKNIKNLLLIFFGVFIILEASGCAIVP